MKRTDIRFMWFERNLTRARRYADSKIIRVFQGIIAFTGLVLGFAAYAHAVNLPFGVT